VYSQYSNNNKKEFADAWVADTIRTGFAFLSKEVRILCKASGYVRSGQSFIEYMWKYFGRNEDNLNPAL
jgi:hypothetical protein